MKMENFSFSHLFLYFLLVSFFLFVSGNIGRFLIENQGMNRQAGMLLQGVIFTGLTLAVIYILKRKNPDVIKNIGMKGVHSKSKFIVGVSLPFILLITGIATAYLFGGIDNVSLNLTTNVVMAVLINSITAFLYEAFPEEVFIRGLIFNELNKKFRFIISLVLQPLIFVCVPIVVMALSSIFFGNPFAVTLDYLILLISFGIALQLYRKYTGSLWMSMIFHVIYLEVARYISMGGVYDPDVALLEFDETSGGFMTLYLSYLFIIMLSVLVLGILVHKRYKKNET